MRVSRIAKVEAVELDDAEDQFAEQRRYADDKRFVGQRAAEARHQVQRAKRDGSGHLNRMTRSGWNPDAAMDRDDPRRLRSAHSHDALRCINQLVPGMRMRFDNVTVGIFGNGPGTNLVLVGVKKPVALFRHRMAIYRKTAIRSKR